MVEPLKQADVYGAVYAFIMQYIAPDVLPEHCLRGWQNRATLPENTNNFVVIALLGSSRVGTNKSRFSFDPATEEDGKTTYAELLNVSVQIDFFAEDESAQARAQKFELIMRSPVATDFFEQHGITALYADDVRDLTGVDGSNQFVQRYSITLHLSYWARFSVSVPWFDDVNLVLKNPDVLFETE